MKLLAVRDFRNQSAKIWKSLKQEREMVITSNGKPVALLMPVEESSVEEMLSIIRQARATAALHALHLDSMQKGKNRMPLEKINTVIDKARTELYK
jgi:prevent-host-death family protein